MKDKIINLLSNKIETKTYYSLYHYALHILKEKMQKNELRDQEKLLLVNDFLADELIFDEKTDEPIDNCLEIEMMIDFLLKDIKWESE